ncbi:MAG: hypothetical protein AAGI25_02695 [Bacteroidota bacterium]
MTIITLFVLFLVLAHYYLNDHLKTLTVRLFLDKLEEQSNNKYTFNSENPKINLFQKKIVIKNFVASPKSSEDSISSYEIAVGSLALDIYSFWYMHFDGNIQLNGIRLSDLKLIITQGSKINKDVTVETSSVYESLDKYLEVFKVGYFNIENAEFKINDSKDNLIFQVKDFDFNMDKFFMQVTDDNSNPILKTEKVSFNIRDEKLLLKDGSQRISFDSVSFSTKTNKLEFYNFFVGPTKMVEPMQSYFFPYVGIFGINHEKAYQKQQVFIDTIKVNQPDIRLKPAPIDKEKNPAEVKSLFKDIFTRFIQNLQVNFLDINGGKFVNKNENKVLASIENVNLKIEDIEMDSSFFIDDASPLSLYKSFSVSTDSIYINDANNKIQINGQGVTISTFDSTLLVKNIEGGMRTRKDSILLSIEEMRSDTFYIKSDSILQIMGEKLTLSQPQFSIVDRPTLKWTNKKSVGAKSQNVLPDVLFGFNEVYLNQGKVNIQSDQMDLEIDKVTIKTGKLSNMDDAYKKIDYLANNTLINLEKISFKFEGNSYYIESLKNDPDHQFIFAGNIRSEIGSVEKISITDLEYGLLENGILKFNSSEIANAQILLKENVSKKNGASKNLIELNSIASLLEKIIFKNIDLSGINLKYQGEKFESTVKDISARLIRKDTILTTEFILGGPIKFLDSTKLATVNDFEYDKKDSSLVINKIQAKFDEIGEMNADSIVIGNLYSITKDLKEKFKDIDVSVFQPKLNIQYQPSRENEGKNSSGSTDLPVNIPNFRLVNGILDAIFYDNEITIDQIHIASKNSYTTIDIDSLVNNLDFSIENLKFKNPSLESINLGKMTHNSSNNALHIDDLYFKEDSTYYGTVDDLYIKLLQCQIKDEFSASIDSVFLTSPNITWSIASFNSKKKDNIKDTATLSIPITLNHLVLNNGHFALLMNDHRIDLNNIEVSIDSIDFTKSSTEELLSSADISLKGNDFYWITDDSLHKISIEGYEIDSESEMIQLLGFKYLPLLDKEAFNQRKPTISDEEIVELKTQYKLLNRDDSLRLAMLKRSRFDTLNRRFNITATESQIAEKIEKDVKDIFSQGSVYQSDWISAYGDEIKLMYFDKHAFVANNQIKVGNIEINGLVLDVYRDKRLPRPPNKFRPLVGSMLKNLSTKVLIDTLNISASRITNEEYAIGGRQSGAIDFLDVTATLSNVTNMQEHIDESKNMLLCASGKVEEAPFTINTAFDLSSSNDYFVMKGQLDEFDLNCLNPILENVAFVKVESGVSENLEFNFKSTNEYAIGKMTFQYDNLKIALVNKENYTTKGKGANVLSFVANTFVIKKRNPKFIFLKEGDIYFVRHKNKSIFNYWTKTLLSGIISSVGAKSHKKDIKRLNEEGLPD